MKLTKKQKEIYDFLLTKPGYLKKSTMWLIESELFPMNVESLYNVEVALKQARYVAKKKHFNDPETFNKILAPKIAKEVAKPFKSTVWGQKLESFKKLSEKNINIIPSKKLNPNNVIFLPDLHAPFIKEGVLEFCKEQQEKYDCGRVIFAGDIIDGHAWSYHEHDPDGYSVGDELAAAREQLQPWFKAFPEAISLMGNHDLLIQRKARTIGLSKHFIKGFGDVVGAPKTWNFGLEFIQDNVLYKHGNVGDAFKVAKESRISTCQGHFHSKTFVQWSVSEKDAIFGMQVGWGADRHSYAFDYGKSFTNKPIISLGVVLDNGKTPIVKLMDL